ncbi:MAG: dihydroorotate dehydrogenase electron transfer subunit [Synergistaceae bacterium]|jgi:dihydroorotate dehydrogenase electron transfer subunit|nr:dihydroorotate dehydrogenase electron transfer subunit [Synergistaceae bacterium]
MKSAARDIVSRVISNERIADRIHDIRFALHSAAEPPLPGQFAHVSVPGVFLRRPISIAGFDPASRIARLIVRVAGRGTDILSHMKTGDETRMTMPLGNPYPIRELTGGEIPDIWLVGGGIGAAPLLYAADYISRLAGGRAGIKTFLGFRDAAAAFGASEFEAYGETSLDIGGFVTDALTESLGKKIPDAILACGPAPMLSSLQKICARSGVRAYASLEERMGCGVGACLVCNCGISKDAGDEVSYKRVCRDGPVFPLPEVVFK